MSERLPARTLSGRVEWLGRAPLETFETEALQQIDLTYEGIPGDLHRGLYRLSGAREPWYKRGTPMRNERQLSILSVEEMAEVAADLGLAELPASWIGGNLLLSGIAQFSQLPPRSILMFPSGAAVRIDGDNGPCRHSGAAIGEHIGDAKLQFAFVKAARHKRGLVGWVEREGPVSLGEAVEIRVWEQALYEG